MNVAEHLIDLLPLRRAFERISPLSDACWAPIEPWITRRQLRAGEQLLRAGEQASLIFFVRRGLLREYYLDTEGRTATRRFCEEDELSGSLAHLRSGRKAMVCVEAVEPSEIWQMPWIEVDALTRRLNAWQLLARRFAENLYAGKIEREFEMLTLSAAERHAHFCIDRPALEARLPQHLVASYLGITPVHLSRIRAARPSRQSKGASYAIS